LKAKVYLQKENDKFSRGKFNNKKRVKIDNSCRMGSKEEKRGRLIRKRSSEGYNSKNGGDTISTRQEGTALGKTGSVGLTAVRENGGKTDFCKIKEGTGLRLSS